MPDIEPPPSTPHLWHMAQQPKLWDNNSVHVMIAALAHIWHVEEKPSNQGCQNGAFGKRSFCRGDTRHLRHFRRFPGFKEQNFLFLWVDSNIRIFANFRQNHLFSAGDKTTLFQSDRFDDPEVRNNNDAHRYECWHTLVHCSERLEKAVTVHSRKTPLTGGGDKVRGSVDPRFAAGLPFPIPK